MTCDAVACCPGCCIDVQTQPDLLYIPDLPSDLSSVLVDAVFARASILLKLSVCHVKLTLASHEHVMLTGTCYNMNMLRKRQSQPL